jgi:hypothetical protein
MLFGGLARKAGKSTPLNDAWLWTGQQWQRDRGRGGANAPVGATGYGYRLVDDPALGAAVLGGFSANGGWGQWAATKTGWRVLSSSTMPAQGETGGAPAVAVDPQTGRLLDFQDGASPATWAGMPPGGSTTAASGDVVFSTGAVGALAFGTATIGDVVAGRGIPDAQADVQSGSGSATAHALGYGCDTSGGTSPSLISLGSPPNGSQGEPQCKTVFWLDATTGQLESFQTVDPAFRTPGGTRVGTTQTRASANEHQGVDTGCNSAIHETSPQATLELDLGPSTTAATSQSGASSTTSPEPVVQDLLLQSTTGAFGGVPC